jgi:hypothetical protein
MKYIITILLLSLSYASQSQTFINRSGAANTVIDARLGAGQNFYLPRLLDSTLSGGKDSIGDLIYDRLRAKIWVRDTVLSGGHKFTQLFKEDDTASMLATKYDLSILPMENISNTALTADGNYAHNWNNKTWYVDSIASQFLFRMGGVGNTGTRRKEFRINWGGSSFGDNLDGFNMLASVKKADLSADSLTIGLMSSGSGVLSMGTYNIAASSQNTFISYNTFGLINISARDSIWIKGATPAATADSVLGVTFRSPGVSKIVKIPLPTGGGGALNNIGPGFRWLATPAGDFKTVSASNTILWDSTANTLTPKVDTFVVATRYSFENMAELRAFDASVFTNNTYINLAGFYEKGDGGGGQFVWSSTSSTADDSGTVIKATPVTNGRWLRVYNDPINAFWFGAIPNGTRIITNALQNALNKTGQIIVPYANRRFIIDDRLLIKSNTFLDINLADTIYLADGTNTVMIRNFTIDTTGITDHDITIKGGIWDNNWAGNPGTNAFSLIYKMLQSDKINPVRGIAGTLDFLGIRNLKVLNLTVRNGLLFPIHITHSENLEVGNIFFDRDVESISDGVHLSTPQYNFYVHDIAGENGDDVVALGAWEWLIANPGSQQGDIKKGTIERIRTDTCAWSLVKMYTGNTGGQGGIYDVVIKDIKGISRNQAFYWGTTVDQANPEHTTGTGLISNVTMEDVHASTLNAISAAGIDFGSVVLMDCNFINVSIKNITMDAGYTPAPGEPWLRQTVNSDIKSLTIENFTQRALLDYGWLFDLYGTGDGFSLSQSSFTGPGAPFTGNLVYQKIRLMGATAWDNIMISNNQFDGVAGALRKSSTAGGSIVNLNDNVFRNYNSAIISESEVNVSITGNQLYNGSVSVITMDSGRVYSAGNVMDYVGAGVTLINPGGTVKWVGTDLPVDVSDLTPALYDMVNNNNPDSALGIVQFNQSGWVSVTADGGVSILTGQVAYGTATNTIGGSNNNFWDNGNIRQGYRTISPSAALHVAGNDVSNLTARFGGFGIQSYSNTNGFIINNGYFDNAFGVFKYLENGESAWLQFASGNIYFSAAPSGSSGGTMSPILNMLINNTGVINIPNIAGTGTRIVTASPTGNLASSAATFDGSGNVTFGATNSIVGTATNNNAVAGNIGEYISSTIASGSAVALSTTVTANVTSISLTAGDWDVTGVVDYVMTSATVTNFQHGSSATSATLGAQDTYLQKEVAFTGSSATYADIAPTTRISIASTTTVYLVSQATFSGGSVAAYGTIRARRVR